METVQIANVVATVLGTGAGTLLVMAHFQSALRAGRREIERCGLEECLREGGAVPPREPQDPAITEARREVEGWFTSHGI